MSNLNNIKVGDWVKCPFRGFHEDDKLITAKVVAIAPDGVVETEVPFGRFGPWKLFANIYAVKLLPIETFKESNSYLIDLALKTNDKEWFIELTGI